mmetsp:Transcript_1495/g.4516  ORF Transcript_1495/g.4516 Transcript_1495/m.4516 type:complete len:224 (+) Transcript_1495:323-994(+)
MFCPTLLRFVLNSEHRGEAVSSTLFTSSRGTWTARTSGPSELQPVSRVPGRASEAAEVARPSGLLQKLLDFSLEISRDIVLTDLRISRCSSTRTARSMLLAGPFILSMPFTSSSAVSCSSPSSTSSKRESGSRANRLTSQSMEPSHCLTTGSWTISRNSALSRTPFPSWSAALKRTSIFLTCVLMTLSLWFTMMRSSVEATLNVTCRNTPMMTFTTAKPMMHW